MVGSSAGHIAASLLRPGLVLGGRYRLLAPIGAGGMGEVWRAEHTSLGTPAAVKVMDASSGPGAEERLKRFHQEARAAAHLRSTHIVQVLDHGVDGRFAFIVMELLVGEGLEQRIARAGRLTPAETARVIAGMARGLSRAHSAGILHRDLKPANVFLARDAGAEVVKLLDFGIAKILGPRTDLHVQTHQGNIVGTPSYMSPEQVRGQEVDPRSDLWQMGIIALECVTGQRPLDGATLGDTFMRICTMPLPAPSTLAPVPPGFDAWVARALDRDRERRFSTATEMAAALLLILSPGDGDLLVSSTTGIRTGRHAWSAEMGGAPGGARRWWVAASVGAVAAVATAGLLWLWPSRGPAPEAPTAGSLPISEAAPPLLAASSPPEPGPSTVAKPSTSATAPPAPTGSAAATAQPTSPRPTPWRPKKTEDPIGL